MEKQNKDRDSCEKKYLAGLEHSDYNRKGRRFDPVNSHKASQYAGFFNLCLLFIFFFLQTETNIT
jgi:hypothetical protein